MQTECSKLDLVASKGVAPARKNNTPTVIKDGITRYLLGKLVANLPIRAAPVIIPNPKGIIKTYDASVAWICKTVSIYEGITTASAPIAP